MPINVSGQVAAGRIVPFPTEAVAKRKISLPLNIARTKGLVVYEVCGDSLQTADPRGSIYDGDYVITRPARSKSEVCDRLCVVLLYGSERVVKRVRCNSDGTITLIAANSRYKPQNIEHDAVEVEGIVIGVYRHFQM